MTAKTEYTPGPAAGARIDKSGDNWTLVLTRELQHAPEMVWQAITDPVHLREWAPFDADGSLANVGAKVMLTTVGAPSPHVTETTISRSEPPSILEYNWGGSEIRWKLEPVGQGTRLTLWHNIDRRYIAMGAAGWHICFDVLDRLLDEKPIGRMVGLAAMQFGEWQRLLKEYSALFQEES